MIREVSSIKLDRDDMQEN